MIKRNKWWNLNIKIYTKQLSCTILCKVCANYYIVFLYNKSDNNYLHTLYSVYCVLYTINDKTMLSPRKKFESSSRGSVLKSSKVRKLNMLREKNDCLCGMDENLE